MTSHLMLGGSFISVFILYFCFCLTASNAFFKDFTTTNSQSRPRRWFSAKNFDKSEASFQKNNIHNNDVKHYNDKRPVTKKNSSAEPEYSPETFVDAQSDSLDYQPTTPTWRCLTSTTTRQPDALYHTDSPQEIHSNGVSSSQESSIDSSKSPSSNDILVSEQPTEKPLTTFRSTNNTERPSEKLCRKLERDCESRNNSTSLWDRIAGGVAVKPKTRTFMVLVGYGTMENREWQCGGSLLNERYVLSAAHCAAASITGKPKWARVGELDYSEDNDDAKPQDREIVETIIHPNYEGTLHYNDIALFKLDLPVIFNNWVTPICLPTAEAPTNIIGTVAGWGRTDLAASVSVMLLEAHINIFNRTDCLRLANDPQDPKLPRGIDVESMICAGDLRGGKDACAGDSGGPLFIETNSCVTTQFGITSFGKYCGVPNYAGVYTNVFKYTSWIESVAWGTS